MIIKAEDRYYKRHHGRGWYRKTVPVGTSDKTLAKHYNVSRETIRDIRLNKRWQKENPEMLKEKQAKFKLSKVISIKILPEEPIYGVSVEEDESHVTGGIITHNTGRPRKCGWLNLDQLQRAVMVNGCSEIALTKVDTLAGLKEVKALWQGQYISFDGWGSLDGANVYETLPSNLKQYMSFIEKTMNTKIKYLSLGRETDRTIVL